MNCYSEVLKEDNAMRSCVWIDGFPLLGIYIVHSYKGVKMLTRPGPPDAKNWLIGKELDAGKDWRHEEKGTTEDEMFGWHHRLNGHESE